MRLIAILLALWAKQYPQQLDRLHATDLFYRYARRLQASLPASLRNNSVGVALLLIPPVLVVWLLQNWIGGWFFGLGGVALAVAVLVFAFCAEHSDVLVEQFLRAWRSGDRVLAREAVAALNGVTTLGVPDERLPEAAVRGLFCYSHERIFGVLFWLVLLGPVGAFAYHLIVLARRFADHHTGCDRDFRRAAKDLAWGAGWLPARAGAGAFALAGSFSHCLQGWRERRPLPEADGNAALLAAAGLGALGLAPSGSVRDLLDQTLNDARSLIRRAIMVWLVIIALLTLFGWIP
ncbi:MAG TPA: regulatory signaling modulator protein AmpE [Nitrococcus sp.]|nr:regulatory signaling modulator protein AmpE [Nitrococcus sp.]